VFQKFAATAIKPFATAPARPEVYETDESPMAVFSSVVTEVYRVKFNNEVKLEQVKAAWSEFVSAVKKILPGVPSLCGISVNLDEDFHVGILGWDGLEVRQQYEYTAFRVLH
jgi:hypothetical protein